MYTRIRFLNVAVATEVQQNPELFLAWCLTQGDYDEDIDPLHNPDWVRSHEAAEVVALAKLKARIAAAKAEMIKMGFDPKMIEQRLIPGFCGL